MDGFAVRSKDIKNAGEANHVELFINETVTTGKVPILKVGKGESAKIMTGAVVPEGADAVVMIEDTEESNGKVKIKKAVKANNNLRFEGEEIRKGETALKRGHELTPPSLGFIAGLEFRKIKVHRKPKLALLATGGELLGLNQDIKPGKIRDTNSVMLENALSRELVELVYAGRVKDKVTSIKKAIEKILTDCDVLIITGGVSVGEYDFVKEVLNGLGVRTVFWRVSQRPGGPMFFGIKKNTLVFGLPGNPASSLVCFYEYIRPAVLKMVGKSEYFLLEVDAILQEEITKKSGKTQFIRGSLSKKGKSYRVRPSGMQGSHILKSFAESNCLIVFPKNRTHLPARSTVTVHLLP